jgi:hypothetical protein
MRIAVGCDHVGFPLKTSMVEALEADEHAVLDLGAHGTDPVDYPVLAKAVATAIGNGFVDLGVEMEAPRVLEVSPVETLIASMKDDNVRTMATRILECVRERFPSAAGAPSSDGFSFSVNGEHAASVTIGKGFVQIEAGPDRIPTSRIRDVEGLEAALSLPSIMRALEAVKA